MIRIRIFFSSGNYQVINKVRSIYHNVILKTKRIKIENGEILITGSLTEMSSDVASMSS